MLPCYYYSLFFSCPDSFSVGFRGPFPPAAVRLSSPIRVDSVPPERALPVPACLVLRLVWWRYRISSDCTYPTMSSTLPVFFPLVISAPLDVVVIRCQLSEISINWFGQPNLTLYVPNQRLFCCWFPRTLALWLLSGLGVTERGGEVRYVFFLLLIADEFMMRSADGPICSPVPFPMPCSFLQPFLERVG
jgi:hypothetical protein